ncbi:hypothetical protein DOT_1190 [Desulfosporosinus sp. OT]|nr:hypothetical protein DOT_1190 [Desulfosporosinus sp. OT]
MIIFPILSYKYSYNIKYYLYYRNKMIAAIIAQALRGYVIH